MADKLKVFTLSNLQQYDGLIKGYVDAADAKSLKTVTITGNKVNFYRTEEPIAEGATPAYTIELPETDLSGLIEKLENATAGNVVIANADGTVADGGVALADLATKTEVEAVDTKADANATAIEAINNEETGILAQAKDYADSEVEKLVDGTTAVGKATQLETARTIDGIKFDGITDITHYAECNDDYGPNSKNVTCDGFVLQKGAHIRVKFTSTNTFPMNDTNGLRLNVNNTGYKPIIHKGSAASALLLANNLVQDFIYDGENYVLVGSIYNDTNIRQLINTNANAIATLNGDDTTEGSVAKAVKDASDAINATIGTVEEGKTVVGMIEEVVANAYDDTEIRELISDNAEAIEAHKEAIDTTVTTLVGNDTGKSVRTIANEELAAQLLSGEADADFQTLQELAAWLEAHPEDVATINLNITNLQNLVGTLPEDATATDIVGYIAETVAAEKTRAEGIESGLDTRLKAVEEAVGEGGSVDTQIANAIADLDADVTSAVIEAGKGLQVQVVEVDGKVTAVNVTGNYDETYEAKGAAATAESNANTYADGLNTAMDTRVTDLEGLVGDGYEAIPEADIKALFGITE